MRSIKIKYHTQIEQRRLLEKVFIMETIKNLDEAIDQICAALSEEEQKDPFAEDLCPYFGVLWPAAEGLSQFLCKHQELVKMKTVLELGCGLAYPSLVCAHLGAEVLATDFHPDVEEFVRRNARHTNIDLSYQRLNWRESTLEERFDVVIGSDVLYESKHALEVAQGLIRFLKPDGKIVLSDPGRSYLQRFVDAMNELGFRETVHAESVGKQEIFVIEFNRY